nr:integrase arm-type DNA-binding domain-containing protein [uncultured Roseateles sp.]
MSEQPKPPSKTKLTKAVIDALPHIAGKQYIVGDTELKGFAVRVGATSKTFIAYKRLHNGAPQKVTLGKYGALTVEQARKLAQEKLSQLVHGVDINAEKKAARLEAKKYSTADAQTLQWLLDFYKTEHIIKQKKGKDGIVGSPNLTVGALSKNSELSVLITSDDDQSELKQEIAAVIRGYWDEAETVSQEEADNYRMLWKLKSRELKKVADIYGDRKTSKPAVQSSVMPMDWASYLAKVKQDKTHGFKDRLAMLKSVREQFDEHEHFNDIPFDARRGIAGLVSESIPNSEWFGSMIGAGTFYSLINQEHEAFSLALDAIPRIGEIRKEHFDRFIAEYLKAYRVPLL